MLEEENILKKCEYNRQESDKEENEDVDIKEEATDCDEDCNFQDQNKLPGCAAVALEMIGLREMEMKEEEDGGAGAWARCKVGKKSFPYCAINLQVGAGKRPSTGKSRRR